MAYFNRDSRGGGDSRGPRQYGGGGGGNRGGFGGQRRDEGGERQMHNATCTKCGNECQVPFKPNGSKPIFCNNCFDRDARPTFGDKPAFGGGEQHSFAKPSFDRGNSPASSAGPSNASIEQLKTQLEIALSKLDRIIKLVSPTMTIEAVKEEPKAKKAPKFEATVAATPEVEAEVEVVAVEAKPKKRKAAK